MYVLPTFSWNDQLFLSVGPISHNLFLTCVTLAIGWLFAGQNEVTSWKNTNYKQLIRQGRSTIQSDLLVWTHLSLTFSLEGKILKNTMNWNPQLILPFMFIEHDNQNNKNDQLSAAVNKNYTKAMFGTGIFHFNKTINNEYLASSIPGSIKYSFIRGS